MVSTGRNSGLQMLYLGRYLKDNKISTLIKLAKVTKRRRAFGDFDTYLWLNTV
jgi:hypothetical protein